MIELPQFALDFQEWMRNVTILDEMLKGFLIGILCSAPMGPVGILTIQRTLNKGRMEGLATGVGASVSDILYAVITGYGMAYVVDIIENPAIALIIKVGGSVLLFAFGIYTYRSKPKQQIKDDIPDITEKNDLRSFAVSGFAVTVSNPLIIFLFLALFSQFTFVINNFIPQVMGYIGLVAGALAWWFALTWVIDKVRAKFDYKVLWWINRIIGIAVMVISGLIIIYTVTGHSIPFHY